MPNQKSNVGLLLVRFQSVLFKSSPPKEFVTIKKKIPFVYILKWYCLRVCPGPGIGLPRFQE